MNIEVSQLLLKDVLSLFHETIKILVLFNSHPFHPIPILDIILPLSRLHFNPLLLLLLPDLLGLLLKLLELEFEQRNLLLPLGSLDMIHILVLLLQSHL